MSSDSSTFLPPRRQASLMNRKRPPTPYYNKESSHGDPCPLPSRPVTAMASFEFFEKAEPACGQSGDRSQTASTTLSLTTTVNNPSMHATFDEINSPRSPSLNLTSTLKHGIQSLGRRMSVSIRQKSLTKRVNYQTPSPVDLNMSPDHSHYSHHSSTLASRQKPPRWFRRPSTVRRIPSLPLLDQSDRPAVSPPAPATCRGTPSPPWDMYPGAAARAAAAAQNEAFHDSQRQSPPIHADMHRVEDLNRDSESGIGIDMQEQPELMDLSDDVIRKDPARVLPVEIMEQVLCFLDPQSLARAESVCHDWRTKARSRHVWRHVFEREYNAVGSHRFRSQQRPFPVRGVGKGVPDQDWRRMYLLRRQIDNRWAGGKAAAIYLNGHKDSVYCVQFDEHKIITGSRDRTIRVWDTHTFQCIKKIGPPGHSASLSHVTDTSNLHPKGAIHIQNNSSLDPCERQAPHDFHVASILCLQFDKEIMVTGSSDRTAIVWSIKDNYKPLRRLRGHTAGVLDVCIDEKCIVTCSKDTTICVWDRKTGDLIKKLTGHRGPVNAVQMRGNLLASASGDGMAKLWNVRDGLCVKEFASKDRGLACVEFSEDGRSILAGGNDQVIYEYDTSTGDLVRELVGHRGLVRSLHLDSSNNRIVSGSYDMSVKVWDGRGEKDAGDGWLKINFQGWTTSWMLAAKSDYRKIVCTSQDGRVVIMDFGYALDGVEILEA